MKYAFWKLEHNTKNATCTVLLEIGHGENEVEENFYFAQYERLLALRASQRKNKYSAVYETCG